MTLERFTGQNSLRGVLRTIRRSVTSPHPHKMKKKKKNNRKTKLKEVSHGQTNTQTPLSAIGRVKWYNLWLFRVVSAVVITMGVRRYDS